MTFYRATSPVSRFLSSSFVFLHRRLLTCPSSARLSPSVFRDDTRRLLDVTWDDGSKTTHPFTWLKDCCPCSACAHPVTLNRRTTLQSLDLKCSPHTVAFDDGISQMTIEWNDGHTSPYPYRWLQERCFLNPKKENTPPPLWKWGKGHRPQQFHWNDLVNDDSALLSFISSLKSEGVSIVKNAPCDNDGLDKLVGAIGIPWGNHYGEYFDVISKNDPSNIAYTPETLSPHIDLPYYFEPPGIQFLHCIKRTPDVEGGQNQLVDGFFVADALQGEDPEAFQLLCETPIHYWDYGSDFMKDFHFQHSQRIIQFDNKGNYARIVFSVHFRDCMPCVPLEDVELFYRSIKLFEDLSYRESIEHDSYDGDILVVNNHRVLHGRSAYRVTGDGMRHLRGTYITWDIMNSRFRRLKQKLGVDVKET